MRKQLIITGFHRSGTSMLSQELKNAGLFIGESLMDPAISNADGHFEDMDFFYLQERLLHINGTNWQYIGDKTLSVPSYFDSHTNALVAQRDKAHDVWGFKDPRSALFLPYWRERLESPRVLAIYRHYENCANSLLHRAAGEIAYGNSIDVSFWEDPELPYRMWLVYNKQIIAYALAHPEETLLLSHHAVVNGFDVLSKVNQSFDLSLNTDVKSSIKTELITPLQEPSLSLSSSLRQELDEVWTALEKISAAPAKTLPVLKQKHNPTEPLLEIRTLLTSLNIPIEESRDLLATLVESFLDEGEPLEERLTSMNQHLKTFVALGERTAYIEVYNKLLMLYPENIMLYKKLAEIYQAEKAYKKQEATLLKMYSVTPPKQIYPYYPSLLANCYTLQNDFDQAFFYIDRAIKGNPKNPNFYLIKSRIFYALCRYDEMFEQIEMAIENTVNANQTITFSLHKVERFVMIGRHDEGKTLLLSLQEQYPDDSRIEKKQSFFDVVKPMNREAFYASTQRKLSKNSIYAFKLLSLLETIPKLEAQQDIAERIREHLKKLMHKNIYIENTHISFLVDDLPLHYFQAELLLYSIEKNTSFDKSKIIVHCTTRVKDDFINFLKNNGYIYRIVEPYLDGKYCNKLQQLEHFREKKVNVILLDADMFALNNFEILNPYAICGKIVDAPNPPIHILKRIYKEANIEEPSLVFSDWDIQDNSTFSSNFNGGFYYIPLDYVDVVSIEWKKWASWLYERREVLFDTKQQAIHTDQVSMSMTINSLGIPFAQLTANSNCPTHTDKTPSSLEVDSSIKLLHYHRELNAFGLINDTHISNPKINEAIKDANSSIAAMGQSLFYEEFVK